MWESKTIGEIKKDIPAAYKQAEYFARFNTWALIKAYDRKNHTDSGVGDEPIPYVPGPEMPIPTPPHLGRMNHHVGNALNIVKSAIDYIEYRVGDEKNFLEIFSELFAELILLDENPTLTDILAEQFMLEFIEELGGRSLLMMVSEKMEELEPEKVERMGR